MFYPGEHNVMADRIAKEWFIDESCTEAIYIYILYSAGLVEVMF